MDEQDLQILRAVWKLYFKHAVEPYNEINEGLNLPRHDDEDQDELVQRVTKAHHALFPIIGD